MGCGASSNNQPAEGQRTKALTEAEKNAIAVQGLKDALTWASTQAVELGKTPSTWTEKDIKIVVPCMDKIDALKEKVGGVPLVGGGLVKALDTATEPFEGQFQNAALTVCEDERTANTFLSIINNLDPQNAIYLCKEGGVTACADYLKEFAKVLLKELMTPVINDIMAKHPLTNIWKTAIESYNTAAKRVSGIDELSFDLNQYVLDSTLESLHKLVMRKETEIREAPAKAVSFAVQQVFGVVDPVNWKKSRD